MTFTFWRKPADKTSKQPVQKQKQTPVEQIDPKVQQLLQISAKTGTRVLINGTWVRARPLLGGKPETNKPDFLTPI